MSRLGHQHSVDPMIIPLQNSIFNKTSKESLLHVNSCIKCCNNICVAK